MFLSLDQIDSLNHPALQGYRALKKIINLNVLDSVNLSKEILCFFNF